MFRALADPTRRALLDELFEHDGQTLVALTARHDMTRIVIAKHLRLLERAGLVVSRRRGREKLHYLNPVPIRLVYDRWVSKYTETWAAGLADLKTELETEMEKVFEIYIRTTPNVWAGGDARSANRAPGTTSARASSRNGPPVRSTRSGTPPPRDRSPRARTSSSSHRTASSRRCTCCGATRPNAKARHA